MRRISLLGILAVMGARLLAGSELSPCEAYGAADAVFIGEAGLPVRRAVPQADGRVVQVTFSPVTVERAFRGVSTSLVFINTETYLLPGHRYLVYGRFYAGTDMFASTELYGTKLIEYATNDLQFLDMFTANASGATVSGVLELDESNSAHIGRDVAPLPNVTVRLSGNDAEVSIRTMADGYFQVTGLPSGNYTADAQLPDDLIMAANPPRSTRVLSGGCATLRLRVIPNGHIRGLLRTEDGAPAFGESVSLLPADLKSGEADRYFQSVNTDREGRFVFDGVRPGSYLLGRLSFNLGGILIPAVYYPATSDRTAATVIGVGRSANEDVGEFRVPRLR